MSRDLFVANRIVFALVLLAASTVGGAGADAHAGRHRILYNFNTGERHDPDKHCAKGCGVGGAFPASLLVSDRDGNLYGTAEEGGHNNEGDVFELAPDGREKVLYSFGAFSVDGTFPAGGVLRDKAGNLYGTTLYGGTAGGCGTVFRLTATGKEKLLYSFQCGTDGANPVGTLVMDTSRNLYGAAASGGLYGNGTVFKVSQSGTENTLHSFGDVVNVVNIDGAGPAAGLIMDGSGNLYGTTAYGGSAGAGTVYQLATDGTETVLYSFCSRTNCRDGNSPASTLIFDQLGNLDGTTQHGGRYSNLCSLGCGTVFAVTLKGEEHILHAFTGTDGQLPVAGLTIDSSGNLYGTTCGSTCFGNAPTKSCSKGCEFGDAFRLTANAPAIAVLYAFNGNNGSNPAAGLLFRKGKFYGTTETGGGTMCGTGCGTVFKLAIR